MCGLQAGVSMFSPLGTFDVASRTCMLQLNAGDIVEMTIMNATVTYSDATNYPVTLSGFLVSPLVSKSLAVSIEHQL